MKVVCLCLALFATSLSLFSQVGIGTLSPSNASMLEVSATSNGGITNKGLMPPRVPTMTQRDAIPATSIDAGLLVFVEDTGTLEIWNGIFWETIYTLSTLVQTVAYQDFDTNLSWSYTETPVFYSVGNDIWNVVSDLGSGSGAIDRTSRNFLGCRDLNNGNGGGNFFHEIAFTNVNVTGLSNVRIEFDFDVFEFDAGDDVRYEVFHDNIGQGQVILVNGASDLSLEGTVSITIPPSITNVRLTLGIRQNGDADFAGFDNFRVFGE